MNTDKHGWKKAAFRHETILLVVVLLEAFFFNAVGRNFATADNVGNIIRHSTEIGLLALVMMPIILSGGIDLSVGSLLGLCAVLFGKMSQEAGLPPLAAGAVTLGIGALAGGFNAALIAWLGLPPLIVTLGTYSLFRGLAEAITKGTATYSNFSQAFLDFGNGTLLGLPNQAWILLGVAIGVWLLVHRTTFGRSFRAIGFSPEGARYAGLPVARRIAMAYVLAGVVAALAGILLTARVTQARADAGVGYELLAITAAVLGGTSIFGGVGTVHGTMLGVVAVALLTNGLSRILSITNISRELSGMLTGALLVLALAGGLWPTYFAKWKKRGPRRLKDTKIQNGKSGVSDPGRSADA
jgi:ribose/xylose/arabinose/galactoside ABC-type transport system permease subunit